jgi:hypothetical protein
LPEAKIAFVLDDKLKIVLEDAVTLINPVLKLAFNLIESGETDIVSDREADIMHRLK